MLFGIYNQEKNNTTKHIPNIWKHHREQYKITIANYVQYLTVWFCYGIAFNDVKNEKLYRNYIK